MNRPARWLSLLTLALTPVIANAQTIVGIQPFGSYTSGQFDQISLADLNVHLDIPLFQHAARGQGMGAAVHLIYDTANAYSLGNGWTLSNWTPSGGTIKVQSSAGVTECPGTKIATGTTTSVTYAFVDATGYDHPFSATSSLNTCVGGGFNKVSATTGDGSGYKLAAQGVSATVTGPDGTTYSSTGPGTPTTVIDPNGNQGSGSGIQPASGAYSGTLTDSSGVAVTLSGGAYTENSSGAITARSPILVEYLDTSGNTQTVKINFTVYSVETLSEELLGTKLVKNTALVSSIVFPDSTSYQMGYQASPDGSGNSSSVLSSITLPTGGAIGYKYSWPPSSCTSTCSTQLNRTTSDGSTKYMNYVATYYNSGQPATAQTGITKPDGSSEIINFTSAALSGTPNGALDIETTHIWQSASAPLRSTSKCYNGATSACSTSPVNTPSLRSPRPQRSITIRAQKSWRA